jgi:L-lactate dehydrogenase complex protein LldF
MNTCPVYRRSGGHSYHATVPGPIGSILNPLHDAAKYDSLPFACSLCGSCTDVCPVKIPLHHQLYSFRRVIRFRNLLPASKRWGMKAASVVLSRPWLYTLSGKAARMTLPILPRWAVYNRLNPWGRQRELPAAPKKSFRELWREEEARRGDGP